MPDSPSLKILFVASEADPFIKVGGLADVAGSLPRALKNLSHSTSAGELEIDIRLVIPFHPQIQLQCCSLRPVARYPIHSVGGDIWAQAFLTEDEDLPVYFIAGDPIDKETGVYSTDLEADGYKYVFFSLACLELARQLGWSPHILHANDWHTATAVYSLALHRPEDPIFGQTASLLTVHNLPYLGSMTPSAMQAFELPPAEHSDLPAWACQMALPMGLLKADAIVAVSPGYAKEILTEEYGSGLVSFLQAHASKISGILNGLDTKMWNPATDVDIAANFSARDITPRTVNKAYLQEKMELSKDPHLPLLCMVTRLDPQKGVDIAIDALRLILGSKKQDAYPLQMVFLGTGNPVLQRQILQLERDFPLAVRSRLVFSEQLSRSIYAGSDVLLMPSRYEPCGLSQMIAMHYGCVPIARATGGLSDTIHDPAETEQSTGFLFTPPEPEALANAIYKALDIYTQDPPAWRDIQIRGMQQDFSWARSAQEYLERYLSLLH
jgi:starch synthase